MSTQAFLIDTGAVCLVRAGMFYVCRRFLLNTLYSDLRHISDPTIAPPSSAPSHLRPPHSLSRMSSAEDITLLPLPTSVPVPSDMPGVGSAPKFAGWSGGPNGIASRVGDAALGVAHISVSHLARTVFGATFAEACTLFIIVLFQAANVLHESGRVLHFRGSLLAVSLLVLLACPLLQLHLLTFSTPSSSSKAASTARTPSLAFRAACIFVPFALYLLLLFLIPLPSAVAPPGLFESFLARLILLGVLILSCLSALASISAAFALLSAVRERGAVKPGDVSSLEASVLRVRADLEERKREGERRSGQEDSGPWMSRIFGGGEDAALKKEISALSQLDDQMTRSLEDMKARRARIEYAKTFRGRLWNGAMAAFGVYCVFRIISVISNVFYPLLFSPAQRDPSRPEWNVPDIITYVLALALAHLPFPGAQDVDVQLLGRQISLLLVGVVVGGNVRLMLRSVAKALKVTSRNTVASFLMLILTQIMGMYLLSTLVQLRSSVPTSALSPEDPLFAMLPRFEAFGRLFDICFFGTCVAWAAWRGMKWIWTEG